MTMRLIDLNALGSAVASITQCTNPTVQVGWLVARADHLCSPMRSHPEVDFQVADAGCPKSIIHVSNSKYELFAAPAPPSGSGYEQNERYRHGWFLPPDPAPRAWVTRMTAMACGQWVEMTVPASYIAPVVELARKLGLWDSPEPQPLAQVWLLRPRCVGFYDHLPVFLIGEFVANDRIARQGALEVYPLSVLAEGVQLTGRRELFGHHWAPPESESEPAPAMVCAITDGSSPVAAVVARLHKDTVVEALDHPGEPLRLNIEGEVVMTHPFPSRGGVD